MTNLEIEVKFFLEDIDNIRKQIQHAGGVLKEQVEENNIRFEDAQFSLVKNERLLRLRKTDEYALLTYKGAVDENTTGCKVYTELETTVSDFDNMTAILEALGYKPAQRYEKTRETYSLGSVSVCLDRMPYGNFMEIEGDAPRIRSTAEMLGFAWSKRITDNYLAIFERLRQECTLPFSDVTFENFEGTDIAFKQYLHLFTAP